LNKNISEVQNTEPGQEIELQLGDVIQITNPTNENLNNQTFIIDYIDSTKMVLINTETLETSKLKISENGIIGDGTTTKLAILSRSSEKGYARQNGLLPNKWIDIHFGGEYPAIITGEITNLENDMIEVHTIDNDTLYINFDYKGIPEDLPIALIEIREKPQKPVLEEDLETTVVQEPEYERELPLDIPELDKERRVMQTEQIQMNIPVKNVKDQIREFILKANQIQFGDEELGPIVQYVDVSSKAQRYSLETQVSEMLDDMLSTIPNSQRTNRVLNNIHTIIERFKQLREQFSFFDEYGNIEGALINEASYKPLSHYFKEFNVNLYWLLPIVKNIKKMYNVDDADDDLETSDTVNVSIDANLTQMIDIINNYKSNTLPNEQNKYSYINSELNPFFTPFDLINDEHNTGILTEKSVETDMNVIIDNLEDMYSSVFNNNNLRTRRFVIQKYNTGLTKLDTKEITSTRIVTTRVKMTNPDTMSIKSFITLPEPTIRFSKINLPGTSLLDKANLNAIFLNYWQLFNKKTYVNNVFVDDLDNELEHDENNFVNGIKNYVLNLSDDDRKGLTNVEIYSKFIKTIIPKTKILFNLMKKYIVGKVSIVDVVSYLEPFLIYSDNLTYMQYSDIIEFIDRKISDNNKLFIERSREFQDLAQKIKKLQNPIVFTTAYSIISILQANVAKDEVFQGYDINIDPKSDKLFTNSELLRKITIKDANKLYTSAISMQNTPLMFPSEFTALFDDEKRAIDDSIKNKETTDTCKTMIIAKYYTSIDELNNDNGKDIYFDKKYDTTNYQILEQFENELVKMSPDNFFKYLTTELMKKQKITEPAAEYLADTLLNGYKKVINGQYALLFTELTEELKDKESSYYIRKDNAWVIDNTALKGISTDDSSILCNLQEKCINVATVNNDDKCESVELDALGVQNKLLKDIIGEFDEKYKVSKEEFQKNVKEQFDYFLSIIDTLTAMETNQMLKYNNQKYKLGANTEEDTSAKIVSPYAKLINLIIGQSDFIKKQSDIIRFTTTYTRPAITTGFGPLNTKESEYWLYCIKTNVPLLPIFKYNMASAYITNQKGYNDYVDLLISKIGKLSDDGDWWTDMHSGWPIKRIDEDFDEGYEEGFRVNTRAIMEDDAGNLLTMPSTKSIVYNTYETKMISNIANSLSIAMGINVETQKEFIVNCVMESLKNTLESEEDYKTKIKEMAQKSKKIMSYRDFFNNAILYYTFGMFLIAVQTAIPSVKTRKTHPGCIRSFSGYPFEGAGDLSSLTYIACIAHDIRESGEPWNVLKGKKQDVIVSRIKSSIDDVLLSIDDVKRKFEEKTAYLLLNPADEIPEEHDIMKWSQFLPPLVPFKIKHLANVSDEFKQSLMRDLKTGSENQRSKILIVETKIILFSLAIQEKIRGIVEKKSLLLNKANNEPYLENSCCETNLQEPTIEYFMKENNSIVEYNDIVYKLTNILQDVTSFSESALFYSNINTKNIYPSISNQFDEKTIYLAFIYFCRFKSLFPIPEYLLPLCTDKPADDLFNENDSIDDIIVKMKQDGRNYNLDTFLRLLQLIGRKNIVTIDLNTHVVSPITKLSGILEAVDDENDDIVEGSLRKLISNVIDTFDLASSETSDEVKQLNNFLIKNNESMKNDISEFISKNKGPIITRTVFNKAINAIQSLSTWARDTSTHANDNNVSNDKMYNIINFYKTFITNFVNVFPNIILNKVDYKNTLIPNYLGLSSHHSKKIKDIIADYYKKLQVFYGIPEINNILSRIQHQAKNIVQLANNTPSFTSIKYKDKELTPVFEERTSRFLFEYYLLKIFICYIDLSDENDMLVTEIQQDFTETNLFTEEFLADRETKVDFMVSTPANERFLLSGNKKGLRQHVAHLLVSFIEIMDTQKETVDISYEDILDRVFKLREREKDIVTDRLKFLTDEERSADTILKINKLGVWSKGLQKGLTQYVKETYDEEREFRDEMDNIERKVRSNNKNVTNENVDQYMDDYIEERDAELEIEAEEYNMNGYIDDYGDGNYDGEEVENFGEFDS
jgi:hypothetical protein